MPNNNAPKVKARISNLRSMQDLLPKDFADIGGLADQLADYDEKELRATQLRKIFHALKDIERQVKRELRGGKKKETDPFESSQLLLLMPDLAYAKGRKLIPDDFYDVLQLVLRKKVETYADFERAMQFIEAVMAYHKFHNPSGARG